MAARFIGTVSVTWLEESGADRSMRLERNFTFEDAAGLAWTAPKNAVIDGASIPQVFWTSFGPPFVGDYRRASVVHDYFCDVRTRTAAATHRMFYEACRAGGVGQTKAKLMYSAVKTFGPNWRTLTGAVAVNGITVLEPGATVSVRRSIAPGEYVELERWIERSDPTLDEIDGEIERRTSESPELPPLADRPAGTNF